MVKGESGRLSGECETSGGWETGLECGWENLPEWERDTAVSLSHFYSHSHSKPVPHPH